MADKIKSSPFEGSPVESSPFQPVGGGGEIIQSFFILQENGDKILQENGDAILTEMAM